MQESRQGELLIAVYEDKLATRRRLASVDPTNPQWRCDEAEILGLIGKEYKRAGMPEHAIRAHQERCVVLRELANLDPRNRELHRHFSICLRSLAKAQLGTGDLKGALAHQEEALLISRKLRKRASSRAEQIADAETLANAADLRARFGDDAGALEAYEELLPIERQLVNSDPSDTHWQWNMSSTLDRLGDARAALGNPQIALLAFEESLAIRRNLSCMLNTRTTQEAVCSTLQKIGDLKRDAGAFESALSVYEERLALARHLTASQPHSLERQFTLAVSLEDVAAIEVRRDDRATALNLYSESLVLRRQLAELDPLDGDLLQDLCFTLEAAATLTLDKSAALALYEESLSLRRALLGTKRGDSIWLDGFLQTLERVGELRRETDNGVGAIVAYDEMLSFHRIVSDMNQSEGQRAVWRDLTKIADLKLGIRDIQGALTAAEESLAIARVLSDTGRENRISPLSELANITVGAIVRRLSNAELHKEQCTADLIISLDQVCSVRLRAGDLPAALAACEELLQYEDDRSPEPHSP